MNTGVRDVMFGLSVGSDDTVFRSEVSGNPNVAVWLYSSTGKIPGSDFGRHTARMTEFSDFPWTFNGRIWIEHD
jgi:hypothetical protein